METPAVIALVAILCLAFVLFGSIFFAIALIEFQGGIKSEVRKATFNETAYNYKIILEKIREAVRSRSALLEYRIKTMSKHVYKTYVESGEIPKHYPRQITNDENSLNNLAGNKDILNDIEEFICRISFYSDLLAFYEDGDYEEDFDIAMIYDDSEIHEAQLIMNAILSER